jgi:hypothetical protein
MKKPRDVAVEEVDPKMAGLNSSDSGIRARIATGELSELESPKELCQPPSNKTNLGPERQVTRHGHLSLVKA